MFRAFGSSELDSRISFYQQVSSGRLLSFPGSARRDDRSCVLQARFPAEPGFSRMALIVSPAASLSPTVNLMSDAS